LGDRLRIVCSSFELLNIEILGFNWDLVLEIWNFIHATRNSYLVTCNLQPATYC